MVLTGLIAAVMSCCAPWSEAGFVVYPLVAHSSGPRSYANGATIFQPADLPQIVTLEVFMGDMSNVFGYWIDIDCANLSNGFGADLRLASVSCARHGVTLGGETPLWTVMTGTTSRRQGCPSRGALLPDSQVL